MVLGVIVSIAYIFLCESDSIICIILHVSLLSANHILECKALLPSLI